MKYLDRLIYIPNKNEWISPHDEEPPYEKRILILLERRNVFMCPPTIGWIVPKGPIIKTLENPPYDEFGLDYLMGWMPIPEYIAK